MINLNFLKNAKRLPALDWNLTFFGAHEQRVADSWTVPCEKHYAFECVYILDGQEFAKIYDNIYTLKTGDFLIIPPEFSHKVWADYNLKYFCFHFDIDDPTLKVQLIKGLNFHYSKKSSLTADLKTHLLNLDALASLSSCNFDTKMIIQIELSKILQIFYQFTKSPQSSNAPTRTEYARIMADFLKEKITNQALCYIKNGYVSDTELVTVSASIQKVGISSGYGFRVFKETFGISPRQYLSKLKINEAKKLLVKPQYSISDISEALGYTSVANFSRQFKRWAKISPSSFRKSGNNPKW